jgi:hypothetical protein
MTEVISLEAKFKATGTQEVVNGFEQIGKAAEAAAKHQADVAASAAKYKELGQQARMVAAAEREMNKEMGTRMTMFPAFEKAKNSVSQWTKANAGLISGLGVAAGVIYGAGKAAAASYMEFQNYAGSVRDLSAISGTGAEETSRFIQVLDDFQISAQDVTTATKAMTKQGLVPTVETLAKLSDEYKALKTPQEQNAFLLKNLGKGGLAWTNALNQGGDALRDMGDEVNKNLILTDDQIKMSEEARLAIDALSDAWQGVKISVGAGVGSFIVANQTAADSRKTYAEYIKMAGMDIPKSMQAAAAAQDRFTKTMDKGVAMTAFYSKMQQDTAQSNGEIVQTEEEKNAALSMALSGGLKLTEMQTAMRTKSLELNTALTEQTAVLEKLRKDGYSETGTKIQQQMQTVDELKNAITANNAAQTQSYKSFASSILAAKDATLEQQLAFAVASGQISQGAANQQMAQDQLAQAFINGQVTAATYASQISQLMAKVSNMDGKSAKMYIDIFIREHGSGSSIGLITSQAGNNANVQAGSVASVGGNQTMGGAIDDSKATGGQLGGGWTLVGDRPGGQFVEGISELISPTGYVYDAKTSKQILASGVLGTVQSRASGSVPNDTYTNRMATKSSSRIATTSSYAKSGGVAGRLRENNISGMSADVIASNEQTAAQTAAQTVAIQQQLTQYINQQMATMSNGFSMLAGVLVGDNPRAVGAAVSTEFAKLS